MNVPCQKSFCGWWDSKKDWRKEKEVEEEVRMKWEEIQNRGKMTGIWGKVSSFIMTNLECF